MASLFTEHINVRKSNSNIYKLTVIVFANLGLKKLQFKTKQQI